MRAPTPARRRNPEKQQRRALARQREHGAGLRAWLYDRQQAAAKRRQEKREQKAAQAPAGRPVEYLVKHEDAPYAWRRAQSVRTGRRMQPGRNRPHVNPGRDAKSLAAGRLRKELRP